MRASKTPKFADSRGVRIDGLLGRALDANHRGRLSRFVRDETSPAIALFAPGHVAGNHEGDWYGEHAGKWLQAASRACARTGDAELAGRVRRVADFLADRQAPDGYLGTYAEARRFPRQTAPATATWDGAPAQRTWDVWTHAYLVLGFLEAARRLQEERYLHVARRIGDLCWTTLSAGGLDVTQLGNHFGLSATVLLDPAVELWFATGDEKYLELARRVLAQANARPELRLLARALEGADASEIGTGKAYQLCWNLVGLAKLHRATGDADCLEAVLRLWRNVRDHHLTLGGGPWGGVALRSREIFNHSSVFSPEGYVETCSTCAWIQLNRELLAVTGDAAYAEEIERAAYNDLLGAQAPDGEDWCYYSFPNGRRVHTTYWRCCKSSGALALEELPLAAYAVRDGRDPVVNLLGPGSAQLATSVGAIHLEQRTRYPYDGEVRFRVRAPHDASFALQVRVPVWATGAACESEAGRAVEARPGSYVRIERRWSGDDEVVLRLPMEVRLHARASRSVQESRAPDGEPVAQEVMRRDYVAVTRGPLVYATGPIDGWKTADTLRGPVEAGLDDQPPEADRPRADLDGGARDAAEAGAAPTVALRARDRAPLRLAPYFEAGGRVDGAWRLTWLQVTDA